MYVLSRNVARWEGGPQAETQCWWRQGGRRCRIGVKQKWYRAVRSFLVWNLFSLQTWWVSISELAPGGRTSRVSNTASLRYSQVYSIFQRDLQLLLYLVLEEKQGSKKKITKFRNSNPSKYYHHPESWFGLRLASWVILRQGSLDWHQAAPTAPLLSDSPANGAPDCWKMSFHGAELSHSTLALASSALVQMNTCNLIKPGWQRRNSADLSPISWMGIQAWILTSPLVFTKDLKPVSLKQEKQ